MYVLIIDDDPIVQLIHKNLIKRRRIENNPLQFTYAADAIDFILKNKDEHFLIFLDLNMPKMDGWEFLNHIKRLDLEIRTSIIIVTSSIAQSDEIKAREYSNVIKYYMKPLNNEMLNEIELIFNLNKQS